MSASVFLCSPTNSTMFTSCCKVAICDDQQTCPSCKTDVYPFSENMTEQERREAAGGCCNHNTRMARWNLAYKKY